MKYTKQGGIQMKLRQIANNMTELHIKDAKILFSYNTPVSAVINTIVDQSIIDELVK